VRGMNECCVRSLPINKAFASLLLGICVCVSGGCLSPSFEDWEVGLEKRELPDGESMFILRRVEDGKALVMYHPPSSSPEQECCAEQVELWPGELEEVTIARSQESQFVHLRVGEYDLSSPSLVVMMEDNHLSRFSFIHNGSEGRLSSYLDLNADGVFDAHRRSSPSGETSYILLDDTWVPVTSDWESIANAQAEMMHRGAQIGLRFQDGKWTRLE